MRIGKIEIKRRVWVGLGAAAVVTALWWHTARVKPPATAPVAVTKPPFVRLAGVGPGAGNQVLREQAELMDPTPLFFPTEWNFGQRPLREDMLKQPGQVFGSFGEKITLGEQAIKVYGAEPTVIPERLIDVVAQGNEAPFAGMGQIDLHRRALEERESYLQVRDLSSGKDIIGQSLMGIKLPRLDFAPLEFLVVVSSSGMVGEPVLMAGSGWDEVDAFFRSYLVKSFHLAERVGPGRYRVLVGP